MEALVLANGRLTYQQNYPQPQPQANEALIRVALAGICATDLELVKGYTGGFAGVLGHEFVGVVVQAEDEMWIGRRVVGSINLGCNQCPTCRQGLPEHCPRRAAMGIHRRDGAFADYVALPLANLHLVPEEVADETAVFTEPLAAALRIREQVKVRPGMKTAVVGPGRLGLLIAQVLALAGGDVTVIGRQAASLELPAQWGLATGFAADFEENSFDFVVEATGNEAGLATSLGLIRPLGTLILKSTFHGAVNLDLTKLVVSEINVIGSRCGPFAPALRLLARRQIQVEALVDGQYPLHDGLAAFAHAAQPSVRKILLQPSTEGF
ncbi:MAG: alcohol dehydrogenase catalytic domain-containing protein [Ardenticatenaceae bacterium]|nr:alcohol dehydrogenase catalytic domain-containing protein [Ardenticatenaceae bacterium]